MKIRPGPGQRLVIFHLGLSENGVYPLNDDFIGDYDYLIVIHWNCGPLFSDKPLFPCSNDPLQYNPILGVKCGWVKITPTMEALVACRGLCDEGRRQFRLLRRNTEPNLARFRLQSYCFECKNWCKKPGVRYFPFVKAPWNLTTWWCSPKGDVWGNLCWNLLFDCIYNKLQSDELDEARHKSDQQCFSLAAEMLRVV